MASDVITPQKLIDASTDADTYDAVVNGGPTETVVNRAGNTLPSLEKFYTDATDTIMGALGAQTYLTFAEMQADETQPDRTPANVTNDPDPAKNGYYVWDESGSSSEWVRSEIQPATSTAVEAIDDRVADLEVEFAEPISGDRLLGNSVGPTKTTYVQSTINLFDPAAATAGQGVNISTGATFSHSGYHASDYMPVDAATTYTLKNTSGLGQNTAQYDANKVFISGINTSQLTTANNAKFIRMSVLNADVASTMFVRGSVAPSEYVAYFSGLRMEDLSFTEEQGEALADLLPQMQTPDIAMGAITPNRTTWAHVSPNLFNKATVTASMRVNPNNGTLFSSALYNASDYIPVLPGTRYTKSTADQCAEFDEDKVYISGSGHSGTNTFVTKPTARFVRISALKTVTDVEMFVEGDTLPDTYEAYAPDDISIPGFVLPPVYPGQTWNALGDSITQRTYSYHTALQARLGFALINNYGVGGTSIASRGATLDAAYPPMVNRYVDMTDDADLITIMGGTNDYSSAVPLGSSALGSAGNLNKETFYGACNVLFAGLMNKYPVKKLAVFTPPSRRNMGGISGGPTLAQYADAMIEAAEYYCIPVFDTLRETQLRFQNAGNALAYSDDNDGLHPNADGFDLMANPMGAFLEAL